MLLGMVHGLQTSRNQVLGGWKDGMPCNALKLVNLTMLG
jgi:hypothetical protein